LNLYFFTSWVKGKALVAFFFTPRANEGQFQTHRRGDRGGWMKAHTVCVSEAAGKKDAATP
jgi:hypothetical protein